MNRRIPRTKKQTRKTQKAKRESLKKRNFERLMKLPNVHAGLHLAGNAREYATVMNSNVLAGELKHKLVDHPHFRSRAFKLEL